MSGVGTFILGRPRPLPGHRRAGPLTPDYTLVCEEPSNVTNRARRHLVVRVVTSTGTRPGRRGRSGRPGRGIDHPRSARRVHRARGDTPCPHPAQPVHRGRSGPSMTLTWVWRTRASPGASSRATGAPLAPGDLGLQAAADGAHGGDGAREGGIGHGFVHGPEPHEVVGADGDGLPAPVHRQSVLGDLAADKVGFTAVDAVGSRAGVSTWRANLDQLAPTGARIQGALPKSPVSAPGVLARRISQSWVFSSAAESWCGALGGVVTSSRPPRDAGRHRSAVG